MSGIAGKFRFDGESVRHHELDRVANALHQYGPDRSGIAVQGNVGFVHVLMRMTPEDRYDHQPDKGASGAMITADLRIDNRGELLERVGLAPEVARDWPDSRLLLFAWEKFGDSVFPLLRGPFAVAIWDRRNRSLTLARDHLGLNVLMWHRDRYAFTFATMPNGLFAFDGIPRDLCEEKIADFLVLNHADHVRTIYRGIFRVPPAHLIHVTSDGSVRLRQYWNLRDIAPVRMASDAAYADGLREKLDRAVRRQMRSLHTVGALLSGGLDSSSVSALAAHALRERNQRLPAFTGVPRRGFNSPVPSGSYADETPFVEAIRDKLGNVDVHYVRNNEYDDFERLERFFIALNGPVRNPCNFGWVLGLLEHARLQNCRVLLGGLFGNYTISWDGWSQAASHLLRGRLLLACRQWRLYYRSSPYSRWTAFKKLLLEPLVPLPVWNWIDRGRRLGHDAWQDHSPIRNDFANAMGVGGRAQKLGHDFFYRARRDERERGLSQVDYLGDWQAAEKAVTGVEVRDPTADIDVVSYCFGIPPEQFLVEDIDRSLVRRAMWGMLPDAVLTNRLRGLQAADWHEKLAAERGELALQIAAFSRSPLARKVIDLARLERAVSTWPETGWDKLEIFREYNLALTRGIAGARFLKWFESANLNPGQRP
ncbi:MAG TPA: asparagine synthase-related protein [Pseudolabrys sp.]|nr:asparagine synthase-related protein [Pseudolabrys sp.]